MTPADRIEMLQEENRQLREALAPTLPIIPRVRLTPCESVLVSLMLHQDVASYERIRLSVKPLFPHDYDMSESGVRVLAYKTRIKLRMLGVEMQTLYKVGHYLLPEDKEILRGQLDKSRRATPAEGAGTGGA